jgi:hypothetical protein
MHAHGVDIGPVEQRLVGARIIGADALDQFVLAKEFARFGLGLIRGRRRDKGDGRRRLRGKGFCGR